MARALGVGRVARDLVGVGVCGREGRASMCVCVRSSVSGPHHRGVAERSVGGFPVAARESFDRPGGIERKRSFRPASPPPLSRLPASDSVSRVGTCVCSPCGGTDGARGRGVGSGGCLCRGHPPRAQSCAVAGAFRRPRPAPRPLSAHHTASRQPAFTPLQTLLRPPALLSSRNHPRTLGIVLHAYRLPLPLSVATRTTPLPPDPSMSPRAYLSAKLRGNPRSKGEEEGGGVCAPPRGKVTAPLATGAACAGAAGAAGASAA